MTQYGLGYQAIKLAGARYLKRMRETFAESKKAGEADLNHLLACTYMRGIYDLAALYIRVTAGTSMADCLREIDEHVDAYLSGEYD